MLKYSLAGLLILVFVAAISCAAVAQNTPAWRDALVALAVAMLTMASIAAIFRPAGRRAFAGGFALAGWIYFVLVFSPVIDLRPKLPTRRASDWLAQTLHELPPLDQGQGLPIVVWDTMQGARLAMLDQHVFADIVHANWTLLAALAGGVFARWIAGKRQDFDRSARSGIARPE